MDDFSGNVSVLMLVSILLCLLVYFYFLLSNLKLTEFSWHHWSEVNIKDNRPKTNANTVHVKWEHSGSLRRVASERAVSCLALIVRVADQKHYRYRPRNVTFHENNSVQWCLEVCITARKLLRGNNARRQLSSKLSCNFFVQFYYFNTSQYSTSLNNTIKEAI